MRRIVPGLVGLTFLMTAIAIFAVRSGLSSWLEALGFVSGALAVYLAAREHVMNWPVGLITSGAYAVFFFQGNLFADAWLQVVYLILGLLGWYWWSKGKDGDQLDITRAKVQTWIGLGAFFLAFFALASWYLYQVHGAAPTIDAFVTAGSLVAQYLLMRKHIENWLGWVIVNVIYIPLFMWKGWYLTAGLYVIYLVLAVLGMREWSRTSGLKLIEARATAMLIALGTVASVWMGWVCWRFERFFGDWITAVRWSDGATLNGKKLGQTEFTLLKAEVCDPLNVRWGEEGDVYDMDVSVLFLSGEANVAESLYLGSEARSGAWQSPGINVPAWRKRIALKLSQ